MTAPLLGPLDPKEEQPPTVSAMEAPIARRHGVFFAEIPAGRLILVTLTPLNLLLIGDAHSYRGGAATAKNCVQLQ
jgi:hypothetical protein